MRIIDKFNCFGKYQKASYYNLNKTFSSLPIVRLIDTLNFNFEKESRNELHDTLNLITEFARSMYCHINAMAV